MILKSISPFNTNFLEKMQTDREKQETMDHILIRQKDKVLLLINTRQIQDATCVLNVLEELWESQGYSYKTVELRRQIDDIRQKMRKKHEEND